MFYAPIAPKAPMVAHCAINRAKPAPKRVCKKCEAPKRLKCLPRATLEDDSFRSLTLAPLAELPAVNARKGLRSHRLDFKSAEFTAGSKVIETLHDAVKHYIVHPMIIPNRKILSVNPIYTIAKGTEVSFSNIFALSALIEALAKQSAVADKNAGATSSMAKSRDLFDFVLQILAFVQDNYMGPEVPIRLFAALSHLRFNSKKDQSTVKSYTQLGGRIALAIAFGCKNVYHEYTPELLAARMEAHARMSPALGGMVHETCHTEHVLMSEILDSTGAVEEYEVSPPTASKILRAAILLKQKGVHYRQLNDLHMGDLARVTSRDTTSLSLSELYLTVASLKGLGRWDIDRHSRLILMKALVSELLSRIEQGRVPVMGGAMMLGIIFDHCRLQTFHGEREVLGKMIYGWRTKCRIG